MELGKYVVARPAANGKYRVSFDVPKRLRPEGWPATIPLPLKNRTGDLSDPSQCAQVRADALSLYEQLIKQKSGGLGTAPRTWRHLISLYERSSQFEVLAEETKHNYGVYIGRALKYLDAKPHIQPSTMKESDVEEMLTVWNHSQDMKVDIHMIMKLLMAKAVRENWRPDNPVSNVICKRPKKSERRVTIWELPDVERMTAACGRSGHPGLAALIRTVWEVGQRLGDARVFEHGKQYVDGVFRFYQNKTGSYVTIPAPEGLRRLLDSRPVGQPLFVNPLTGQPYTRNCLSMTFAAIRKTVEQPGDRRVTLRNLRHSCVVQLARAECTVPEIASITGHSLNTVHLILQHYLPRDNVLAFKAIDKRKKMMERAAEASNDDESDEAA